MRKGVITSTVKHLKCKRITVPWIWKFASENFESNTNVDSSNKRSYGPKCKDYGKKFDKSKHFPLDRRDTIKSSAKTIKVSKSRLFKFLKQKTFTAGFKHLNFKRFKNYIEFDEKWCYLEFLLYLWPKIGPT